LTIVREFTGSLREKAKNKEKEALNIAYDDASGREPSFVMASYKELFDSIKKPFSHLRNTSQEAEASPETDIAPEEQPPSEPKLKKEKDSGIKIIDFDDIKNTDHIVPMPEFIEPPDTESDSEEML
jgi:hypothetical protein